MRLFWSVEAFEIEGSDMLPFAGSVALPAVPFPVSFEELESLAVV